METRRPFLFGVCPGPSAQYKVMVLSMQKDPITKYQPFPKVELPDRRWPERRIEAAPQWCSVDLRDGNQALAVPMSVEEKLRMFEMLVKIGFKEIEIGFPSASQIEHDLLRRLIEEDRIPDDVTVQLLVQAREHLIRKTFESLRGVKKVIVHVYNSTSPMQRRITFNLGREEVKKIAVDAAKLIQELIPEHPESDIRVQYSPESFSDTELDYSLEVCEAVMEVVRPTPERPIILNLPATVEWATPNIHADQIEWFCRNMSHRDRAIISLHTHNDRGTGVAATELGLMAGADRVEGTLFGNGERTGNLDIVTVALNLYTQGVDPGLDLSDLLRIREVYEECTRMEVHPRHPYAGDLVFTAFSGSHQDAIKKGFDARKEQSEADDLWQVPYLLIDPRDIGRTYEAIIRINSQSGKGGVAHVLARDYGLNLPKKLYPEVGRMVNELADQKGVELSAQEIFEMFETEFVNRREPLEMVKFRFITDEDDPHKIRFVGQVRFEGKEAEWIGEGNGPINATVDALDRQGLKDFRLEDYMQHSVGHGSASEAAAYILLNFSDGRSIYGVGRDTNIEAAGIYALISAFNRSR